MNAIDEVVVFTINTMLRTVVELWQVTVEAKVKAIRFIPRKEFENMLSIVDHAHDKGFVIEPRSYLLFRLLIFIVVCPQSIHLQ